LVTRLGNTFHEIASCYTDCILLVSELGTFTRKNQTVFIGRCACEFASGPPADGKQTTHTQHLGDRGCEAQGPAAALGNIDCCNGSLNFIEHIREHTELINLQFVESGAVFVNILSF